ncbi:MAG: ketol-acid reductoisomerase [Candidatus Methanomethylophilus sp.]|nr:ketol-acid reductoisomerase [Methanomethylophilus sp.]MDD4221516.1 ketol-acid reductoisomerase [Methanomethylophilus sp.]MDD4668347.1 ketol-acid reductoisomerase [Methanomethylophilus sp.]
MSMKIYHEADADLGVLKGKKIAVLGYGAQGRAQSLCFRDSGLDVTIGVRENGPSWKKAKEDGGMHVTTIDDAVKDADVVLMLLPDEVQPDVYHDHVAKNLKKGAALDFAHGFAITYKLIVPPKDVDVIMMAPKAPGDSERKAFVEGFGVPALVCVQQNATGKARDIVMALAKGLGSTRAGVFEVDNFDIETKTDLFGEQTVECGGITALMRDGYNTLVNGGYPPIVAYFETIHECKLIVDLIVSGGFTYMWNVCSNTAKYGGLTRRDLVVTDESRKGMQKALDMIESGEFKTEWRAEWADGLKKLHHMMDDESKLQLETTGKEVRSLFERKAPAKN